MKISLFALVLTISLVGTAGANHPVGDLNGDFLVNFQDLQALTGQWLNGSNSSGDLNDDNDVDMGDFALLAKNWQQATPFISEFMANKGSTLSTDVQLLRRPGEWEQVRPDWIEIHNTSDQLLNLEGWYLTDNKNNLTKWRFPSIAINPGLYHVVFASEKDQKYYPGNYPYFDGIYYHTNFELDRGGEYLALVRPDGLTVAHEYAPQYPQQQAYVSYGYCSNSDEYGYFVNPTPGLENDTTCITDVVADTKFDHDRGFYDAGFHVMITTTTPGATIRYTTDGSEPTMSNGSTYSTKIPINTTTCLRAAAFKTGWVPTNVDTQTYIFLDDVRHQPHNPPGFPSSGWGWNGPDYEVDPHVVGDSDDYSGIYRNSFKDDMKSVPTVSLVMDVDDWFNDSDNMDIGGIYANPEWENSSDPRSERPVSAEFFDPCGMLGEFHINAVVRICGGSSTSGWKSDKLSMRLKFREPCGPTKLNFPLFGDDAADRFDTLVLDARLNNAWNYEDGDDQNRRAQYTRDQFTSDIQNAMGGGYGHHGQHVHLYLNGLYWGLYNFHERPDESFADSYFGGSKKDYDVLKHNVFEVVNGSNANYLEMFSIANAGLSSDMQYQLIQQYLDVPNFIDYMITNYYDGNQDWGDKNWYTTRNIYDPAGRWRYHSWDAEKCMHTLTFDRTYKTHENGDPTYLQHKLATNAEYRMLFADHVHRHLFNDGIVTVANATALYQHRLDVVDRAVVGESARWGDNRINYSGSEGIRYTRGHSVYDPSGTWIAERDWLLGTYFPNRGGVALDQFKSRGWYPTLNAPVFSPHGGWDLSGFTVTMTHPNGSGTIYYATDGNDPRLPGGTVNTPHAVAYTPASEIHITETTQLKARVLDGSTWSALNEAVYAVGPVADYLRITEIMYHPQDTGDPEDPNEEFIELKNIGPETLNLNLVSFTNGIDFTFLSLELAANEYVLVVKNLAAFASQYPDVPLDVDILGPYSGSLNNGGERIELEDAIGQTIHNFRYRDGWYDITDGIGFSLTIKEPASSDPNDWDSKSGWRPSAKVGGSPGWDDTGDVPELGSVKINELLTHSHASPDWIELHNTTGETINIGGWFLSDSENNFMKYEIAVGTTIDSNDYIVFYEDETFGNPSDPCCIVPFALSENGETLYLHSGQDGALTGYSEEEEFGASETDVAFGRYRKSTDTYNFVAMSENTPGWANAYPKVGPIVINEIMYHPASEGDAEFIELYNISSSSVTLQEYDNEQLIDVPWRFTDSGGISFDFPLATTMAAGEYLLLVKDEGVFNSWYPAAPGGVQLFEWGAGRLDNGGEKVQLSKPGDEVEGTRYYIRVDRVNYSDGSHHENFPGLDPWPTGPDGGGTSLSRVFPQCYGNDPNNWAAAVPSPGE